MAFFNNILDILSLQYEYEYIKVGKDTYKRIDKQTGDSEIVGSYKDIVQFYLTEYQNKSEVSGGNEYDHIINELKLLQRG